jgi:hypothetical protein
MSNPPKVVLTIAGIPKRLRKGARDEFEMLRDALLDRFRQIGAPNGGKVEVIARGSGGPSLEFYLDAMPDAHARGVVEAMSAEFDFFSDVYSSMRACEHAG